MSVAYRAGEDWDVSDGAPEGVHFDLKIPSSDGKREYRIVRQEHHPPGMVGFIIHTPPCPAWRAGHRMCRHVLRACELADDPLRTFALDVLDLWPRATQDFGATVYRAAQQAIQAAQRLEEYEDRRDRAKVTSLEAVREFDRGPLGAAR